MLKFRLPAIATVLCLTGMPLRADWKEEIGFTRLQQIAGGELPTSLSQGFTQVEASPQNTTDYTPDTTNPLFSGIDFTPKSGTSAPSNHATHVATNLYSTSSLLPNTAAVPVDLYQADGWINSEFLKMGSSSNPATESRAVQNHSWIVNSEWTTAQVEEANHRLDYSIQQNGFVCVVGENNVNTTILPQFLGQSYHTISVGRDDGVHNAGFTAYDGTGRIKPDIVAPSAAPEYATSWTTPMVGSAAGLLFSKLSTAPYSLTGADRPRVIKALLLSSATKNTVPNWDNTSSRPLDEKYGAGELNIHHAYLALRSGRASYGNTQYGIRGWAAQSVSGTDRTYYFTIPAGAPSTPFSAALIWHRTVTSTFGIPRTWNSTLANLNLRLHLATGTTTGALIAESLSSVDNVELIYQPTLAPGDYALVVSKSSGTTTPFALAWHSLPAVTVAATVSSAREIDGQQGTLTLTRTGDTTLPLYVPLTIGGTSVPGTHYQALPNNITIPAGQSSSTLQIIPISDHLAQGDRTVTVTAANDFASVGDGQPASVTIQDKPFDAWRFARFTTPELSDSAVSSATADPDSDQLPNLIEYALGLDPKSPDTSPVAMIDSGGYLALSTAKNPTATDITWSAEVTDTLDAWTPAIILTNTPSTFETRDTVLSNTTEKRFIRLIITRP